MTLAMRPPLFVTTELGTERRCSRCGDHWPQDEEFFRLHRKRGETRWYPWCRACETEYKRERRTPVR